MQFKSSLYLCFLGAAAVACASCADVPTEAASDEPGAQTPAASVDGLERPNAPFTLRLTFDGGWSAERGLWFGSATPVPTQRRTMSGLVTVAQPGYCAVDADNDGTAGSGAVNTVELVTTNYFALDPFTWAPGGSCDVPANAVGSPSSGSFAPNGVTCGDVTVRSFYGVPLQNVYTQITEFSGNSLHAVYPSATVPPGMAPGAAALGLWSYGTLSASGGAATNTWYFQNGDATDFSFRGEVVAEVLEVCGNAVDEDCDGRLDNGCGTYGGGAACADDIDCASGFCDVTGFCGAATCPNSVIDGLETDVDCGGVGCPACVDGQLCGTGTDCVSGICNATSATEDRCRTARNPAAGEVVVTEFLANLEGDDTLVDSAGEYVELYNATTETLSLEGCRLEDDGADVAALYGSEFLMGPGEYHVFARATAPAWLTSAVPAGHLHEIGGFILGNSADTIRLACGATVVDTVTYDNLDVTQTTSATASQLHAPVVAVGATAASANDLRQQFCDAATVYGNDGVADYYGSPGAANASCPEYAPSFCRFQWPTARPTQAVQGLTVDVYGRVYAAGYTDVTPSFSDAQPTRFMAQVGYGAVGANPATPGDFTWTPMSPNAGYDCSSCGSPENNNDEYTAALDVPLTAGTTYDMAMRFSGDLGATWTICDTGNGSADGYASGDAAQLEVIAPVASPTTRGDMVFSEVMIDMPGASEAGEYLELYNGSGQPLDLQGCVLADDDGSPFTFASSTVVPAGGYYVVGASSAFIIGWADIEDPSMSLANSGEPLTFTCGATTIDEFTYSTDVGVAGQSLQLAPESLDADLNDLDVTFGGQALKTWWCDTRTTAGAVIGTWFDGVSTVNVYGSPGAANPACLPIDYCRLDNPFDLIEVPTNSTHTIQGQLYVAGLTDQSTANQAHHMLRAELGYGLPGGTDPAVAFAWTTAAPIAGWDGSAVGEANNDGYEGTITAPAANGQGREYAFRFSGDSGATWTYCDLVNGGSNGSADGFQFANAGTLLTQPPCPSGFWGPGCANACNCDDGLFCNGAETCDENLGCLAGTAPALPDDGVSCTTATCNETLDVVQQVPSDLACDDGAFCNGAETCDVTLDCQPGAAPSTDDGVACTNDACDEINDVVTHVPDDGACNDGAFCNGIEICSVGVGCTTQAGSVPDLDDGVGCTDDSCDEVNDVVVNAANDANCDNGAFCDGAETCHATLDCQPGTAPTLGDGVDCTDDTCDEINDVVVNTPNDGSCDDSLDCTADVCDLFADCGSTALADQTVCSSCEGDACACRTGICSNRWPYSLDLSSYMTQDCVLNSGDASQDGMDSGAYVFVTDAISGGNLPNDGVVGGNSEHPALQFGWNDADNGNNCWNAGLTPGTFTFAVPPVAQPASVTYQAETDPALGHAVGSADGDGWAASAGTSGHIVYGPYANDLVEGVHFADYRLLLDVVGINSDIVATIDVWDATAGQGLASRVLQRNEFGADFVYDTFTLEFDMVGRAGHNIETRVFVHGASYVRADSVTIRERAPNLHLFGTSVEGASNIDVTVYYEGGGSNVVSHTFVDWFDESIVGLSYLLDNLDRFPIGGSLHDANDPAIYYTTIVPSGEVNQIDISQTSGGRFIFFGAAYW